MFGVFTPYVWASGVVTALSIIVTIIAYYDAKKHRAQARDQEAPNGEE